MIKNYHYSKLSAYSHFISVLIFVIFALFAVSARSQTIVIGTDAKTSRTLPAGFFGYNDERPQTVNPVDPNLLAVESKVFSQVIRTNGEQGNYWDWKTGLFVTNYNDGYSNTKKGGYPRTLATFYQQWLAMHSTPVYMLNMLTDPTCVPPAGGLCQFTPSTPNLSYQLQWLQAAQAMGLPVTYVELGNEFYLTAKPGYQQVFPDPVNAGDPAASTVYARVCTEWIAGIKKQFPQALVAALAQTSAAAPYSRTAPWNAGLFPALQGEDAITFHTYIRTTVGKNPAFDTSDATAMLATPFSNWASLEKDIAGIPLNLPIWITEYDMGDKSEPVWGTWAHGLVVTAMTLLYLEEPRVQMASKYTLVHDGTHGDIFDSTTGFSNADVQFAPPANPPPTALWGRTAANVALAEVGAAVASTSQAVKLAFPGAPTLSGSGTLYGSLYGWSFTNGTARRAVVLNLSNQSLTVDVSGLGLGGAAYDQISGAPFTYVTGGLSGSPSNLTETTGTLAAKSCVLPAYSITRFSLGVPPSHQPAKGRSPRRP
jgi:hypothetical protein